MPVLDESRLDDAAALEAGDARGALRALASAGAQVRRSLVAAQEAGIERVGGGVRPRSVLVASLGGSEAVADTLDLLAEPGSPVPVTSRRSGPLPGWVGPLDLVIAVSQSGRAPGPLALAAEAARRGASLLTVGAADSPLAEVSARARGVHVETAVATPSTRTALFSLLVPVLRAADVLGLASCPVAELEEVANVLDAVATECRPSSDTFVNPAKSLALDLAPTIPVVLGTSPMAGVASRRAAAVLARTARIPATHGTLPHDASSVLACFDGPYAASAGSAAGADLFADPFLDGPVTPRLGLLLLRGTSPDTFAGGTPSVTFDPATEALADAVAEAARESGVRVWEHHAAPGGPVVGLASLIALTDFAATYLALGLGIDPTVSAHVADLRDRTN